MESEECNDTSPSTRARFLWRLHRLSLVPVIALAIQLLSLMVCAVANVWLTLPEAARLGLYVSCLSAVPLLLMLLADGRRLRAVLGSLLLCSWASVALLALAQEPRMSVGAVVLPPIAMLLASIFVLPED